MLRLQSHIANMSLCSLFGLEADRATIGLSDMANDNTSASFLLVLDVNNARTDNFVLVTADGIIGHCWYPLSLPLDCGEC